MNIRFSCVKNAGALLFGILSCLNSHAVNAPVISLQRLPSPMVANQSYTVTWSASDATSLTYDCTSSGTGFVGTGSAPLSSSSSGNADPAWVGYPSTCVWTATGPGGTTRRNETLTTVNPPPPSAPTLTVQRTPSPMVANQSNTVTWSSTYATSVSYACTASGTGYAGSGNVALSSSSTTIADPAWVGYPSTCVWTATGLGGTARATETLTTIQGQVLPPTLDIQRTPQTMIAGQPYTVKWITTNAQSVSYNCTASGTGYVGTGTVDPNSSSTANADPVWVNYPTTCLWTATGLGGSKTFNETLKTENPAPKPQPIAAWTGVLSAFDTGDQTKVMPYFIDPPKYQEIFNAIGSDGLKNISKSLSNFNFIEITPEYATAIVTQTYNGKISQRYVSFIFKDGIWQILDF